MLKRYYTKLYQNTLGKQVYAIDRCISKSYLPIFQNIKYSHSMTNITKLPYNTSSIFLNSPHPLGGFHSETELVITNFQKNILNSEMTINMVIKQLDLLKNKTNEEICNLGSMFTFLEDEYYHMKMLILREQVTEYCNDLDTMHMTLKTIRDLHDLPYLVEKLKILIDLYKKCASISSNKTYSYSVEIQSALVVLEHIFLEKIYRCSRIQDYARRMHRINILLDELSNDKYLKYCKPILRNHLEKIVHCTS